MKAKINKEFQYKNATVVISEICEDHVRVTDVYAGDWFCISKRTLDGLPEPDDGEGMRAKFFLSDAETDRQRVLLEALQAAEGALKNIQADAVYILQKPNELGRVRICAEVTLTNCTSALDSIARTKTPHDDEAVKS